MNNKNNNKPLPFIEILKKAYAEGEEVQIPYKVKNGEIVNLEFFHLLSYLGDDEPIKVVSNTKTKLVLEIQNSGVGKLIKAFEELKK